MGGRVQNRCCANTWSAQLQHVGDPAHVALDVPHADAGYPLVETREEQLSRELELGQRAHGEPGGALLAALVGQLLAADGDALPGVEVEGEVHFLGGLPDRVPIGLAVGMDILGGGQDRADEADLLDALELGDGAVDLEDGQEADAEEPPRRLGAEVGEPIVVGAVEGEAEGDVIGLAGRAAAVEDLGDDAVDVLVFDALGGVPASRAGVRVLHALAVLFGLAPCHRGEALNGRAPALEDHVVGVFGLIELGGAVAVRFGQVPRPIDYWDVDV